MEVWILFALLQSFAGIATYLIADFTKLRGFDLMLWNRIFGFFFLLPILFLIPAPTSSLFYFLCFFTAGIYALYDLVFLDMATKKGAGLPTRIAPLSVWGTFILWCAIHPDTISQYIDNPTIALGIIGSAIFCGFCALRLRHCHFTWGTLKEVLPYVFLSACGAVLSKTAIDQETMLSGTLYYLFMQAFLVSGIYIFMALSPFQFAKKYASGESLFRKKLIISGAASALFFVLFGVFKISAFWLVDNPAYVGIFGLLAPFWVYILKRILKKEEQGDILSGLGLVLGCIFLIVFTRIL